MANEELAVEEEQEQSNEKPYAIPAEQRYPFTRPLAHITSLAAKYLPGRNPVDIPGVNDVETFDANIDRFARNTVQAALTTPSFLPTVYGLSGATKDYFLESDDGFQAKLFEKGGLDRIQQRYKDVVAGASDEEEAKELLRQFKDSKEGYALITENLRPGMSWSHWNAGWAAEVAEERRPDEQTWVDSLQQIIAGAGLGGPRALFQKGVALATDNIANAAIQSTVRGLIRGAEIATPLTIPYTPTNVAMNAGVGLALNEAVRGATQQSGLVHGIDPALESSTSPLKTAQQLNAEALPLDENMIATAGLFAMLGAAWRPGAFKPQIATKHGPTIAEQVAERAKATPGTMNKREVLGNLADEYRPVTGPARRVGGQDFADRLDNELMQANHVSVHNKAEVVFETGLLPDNVRLDVNPQQWTMELNRLSADERAAYVAARHAQQALQARKHQIADLEEEVAAFAKMKTKNADTLQEAANVHAYLQKAKADLDATRPSLTNRSTPDLEKIASAIDAHPRFKQLYEAERRIYNQVLDYGTRNGLFTKKDADVYRARNPDYMLWYEDTNNTKSLWGAVKNIAKDEFDQRGAYHVSPGTRKRTYDMRPDPNTGQKPLAINAPLNSGDAMRLYMNRMVQRVEQNRGRLEITNALERAGLGSYYTNPANKLSHFSLKQINFKDSSENKVLARPTTVAVFEPDGRWRLFEAATPEMANVLKMGYHEMSSLMNITNKTRKLMQAFTTGPAAPWFVPVNALWEALMVPGLAKSGRAVGLMQGSLKRLAITLDKNGSKDLAQIVDYISGLPPRVLDPTTYAAIPFAVLRQLGPKIALDTSKMIRASMNADVGIIGMIGRTPQGKAMLDKAADWMGKAYADSYYQMWRSSGASGSSALSIIPDARKAYQTYLDSGKVSATARGAAEYWMAMIEGIGSASRFSAFSQNMALLEYKYGVGKVPQAEMKALATEMRGMTLDAFRKSGNKLVRNVTDSVPYGNVLLQSGRMMWSHLYRQVRDGDVRGMAQLYGTVLMPAIATSVLMSSYDKGSYDYWWKTLPEWQRSSLAMIPSPSLVAAWSRGEKPPFKKDDYYQLRLPPEFASLATMTIAGLRALGVIPIAPDAYNDWVKKMQVAPSAANTVMEDLLKFGASYIGRGVPIQFQAAGKVFGYDISVERGLTGQDLITQMRQPARNAYGIVNGKMDATSIIPQAARDLVEGLLGTGGAIIMQSSNAALKAARDEKLGISGAFDHFFGTMKHEVQRRTPDVPGLWQAPTTLYQRNQLSQRVVEVRDMGKLIAQQMSLEEDKRARFAAQRARGHVVPGSINDPQLLQAMFEWGKFHNKLWSSSGRVVQEQGRLQDELNSLRLSQGRLKPGELAQRRNDAILKMTRLNQETMSHVDRQLGQMSQRYDGYFKQKYGVPFSLENLSKVLQQAKTQKGP